MSKFLFFSDSHGCSGALRELAARVENESPDLVCFLGDALYHGPRNSIQCDYNPRDSAALMNSMSDRIIAVRGNCDAEVDQMMLGFPLLETYSFVVCDGLRVFLTHGHIYGPDNLPKIAGPYVMVTGHTHVPVLEKDKSGIVFVNPGSIAIPKASSLPSYSVLEGRRFSLKALYTGQEYKSMTV